MESIDKILKRGMRKDYKVVYFDILLDGTFMFQLAYKHCPTLKFDINDVRRKVYERRPSLQGKHIEICETDAVLF